MSAGACARLEGVLVKGAGVDVDGNVWVVCVAVAAIDGVVAVAVEAAVPTMLGALHRGSGRNEDLVVVVGAERLGDAAPWKTEVRSPIADTGVHRGRHICVLANMIMHAF